MKFFMQAHVDVKSINAKFHDGGTHSLAYVAKKLFFRIFWVFFLGFLAKKCDLNLAIWLEILHEDAPGAWQLVCKIWYSWFKGFGRSDAKCSKVSKNAKF